MVVIREYNGILRKADHPEREKILQVYFPKKGKSNYVPKIFEPENLEVNFFYDLFKDFLDNFICFKLKGMSKSKKLYDNPKKSLHAI
jgi:hypothetical protein